MDKERVLAVVNGREITGDDFNVFMTQIDPQVAQYFMMGDHEQEIVEELVNQQLLYLDAKERKLDDDKEFQDVLKKTEESLLKTYAIGKLLEEVEVTDKEIEDFYNAHAEHFDVPAGVHASHILVEDLDKANEIYEKIQNGEEFEELAKEFSTCPSSQRGGDLGVFYPGQMVPEFDEAVFAMEKDEISKPVKTQFGYHIIKLLDKIKEEKHTLSDVKEDVKKEVKKLKDQTAYLDKLKELNDKYEVKYMDNKEKEDK